MFDSNLSQQDLVWGASLDLQFSGETRQHNDTKEWQFRGKENELSNFLIRQSRYTLFFDGAAKGNPGKAGVSGIIRNMHGKGIYTFVTPFGVQTNHYVKAIMVHQTIKLAK